MISTFDIDTPIGRGTIIGLDPDRTRILVMHTRIKSERSPTKGPCYVLWWNYDIEKGAIVDDTTNSSKDSRDTTKDAVESK